MLPFSLFFLVLLHFLIIIGFEFRVNHCKIAINPHFTEMKAICDVYLKILVFKPCSYGASALTLLGLRKSCLNFGASVSADTDLCKFV